VLFGTLVITAVLTQAAGQAAPVELGLTPAAKSSPLGDRWITVDANLAIGEVRQGDVAIKGDWVSRFEAVPASVPFARRAREHQVVALQEMFGGTVLQAIGGVVSVVLASVVKNFFFTATIGMALVAAGIALTAVCGVDYRHAHDEAVEAAQIYNTALNNTLPPDQQLDLGEFGKSSRPQPEGAVVLMF
jgi:hypothetical protein